MSFTCEKRKKKIRNFLSEVSVSECTKEKSFSAGSGLCVMSLSVFSLRSRGKDGYFWSFSGMHPEKCNQTPKINRLILKPVISYCLWPPYDFQSEKYLLDLTATRSTFCVVFSHGLWCWGDKWTTELPWAWPELKQAHRTPLPEPQ